MPWRFHEATAKNEADNVDYDDHYVEDNIEDMNNHESDDLDDACHDDVVAFVDDDDDDDSEQRRTLSFGVIPKTLADH
eukprot:1993252-Amphidinium_carterae.1